VTDLPVIAADLDAVLIGGGFIVRFDKEVAAGYGPPHPGIHHPTGYWLTPALIALQHNIPLIWNAPGMHCNDIPGWAGPLMKLALENSQHIRVRDEPSRQELLPYVERAEIGVLPDTAFTLARLIDADHPSAEFQRLRESVGFTGPYIVLHAIQGMDVFLRMFRDHAALFEGYKFLLIPIGPVLGDHEDTVAKDLPGALRLPYWPQPLLLAEILSHAEGVIGHSYHFAITGLACGVPVFSSANLAAGKYTALAKLENIFPMPREKVDPDWFISRLGKKPLGQSTRALLGQLDEHWDRVADIIRRDFVTAPAANRFWQSLPNLLEAADERAKALATRCETQQRQHDELLEQHRQQGALIQESLDRQQQLSVEIRQYFMESQAQTQTRIDELTTRLADTETRNALLLHSSSFKLTAPLRILRRKVQQLLER
jgi:lipopolysaccharide transport system ATP-binding protein